MKSHAEIQTEASQLAIQARQQWRGVEGAINEQTVLAAVVRQPLFTFPESMVRRNAASEYEGAMSHRIVRSVGAIPRADRLEFLLVEEEFVTAPSGELVRHYDPVVVETDDDPLDLLVVGYRRLDEDRLRERLEPVIDRIEANTFADAATSEDIAEVEELVSDLPMSTASRMRLRWDARDMIEGRMEVGDFIARTVGRQEMGEVRHERQVQRHELKLSITTD